MSRLPGTASSQPSPESGAAGAAGESGVRRRRRWQWTPILAAIPLGLVVLAAALSPWLVPDATAGDIYNAKLPAGTPGHLLGTDAVGRDVLQLTIAGARSTVVGAVSTDLAASPQPVPQSVAAPASQPDPVLPTTEMVATIERLVNAGDRDGLRGLFGPLVAAPDIESAIDDLTMAGIPVPPSVTDWSMADIDFITLRHAFMDDYTRRLAQKIPVAVLGAGYDSRALRLAHHIKHGIWEFDFPATQRRKKFYLRNERIEGEVPHYCEVDFMKESLPEIFERSAIPRTAALVIWEGVSMYVSEDVVTSTLTACRDYFGEGTIVVFDYWHNTMEDPLRNMLVKIMPMVMDVIYSERFTYGATPQQMRELAMSCGARRFESLTGKQIMKKLFLTSRLPLTSASMAVVEF